MSRLPSCGVGWLWFPESPVRRSPWAQTNWGRPLHFGLPCPSVLGSHRLVRTSANPVGVPSVHEAAGGECLRAFSVSRFECVGGLISHQEFGNDCDLDRIPSIRECFIGYPPPSCRGLGWVGVCRACLCSGKWKGAPREGLTPWSPSCEAECRPLIFFPLLDFGKCQPRAQINLPLSS